ncbi:MAG: hypothetical protein NVS4B10_19360 [Myxococcales bacterium]
MDARQAFSAPPWIAGLAVAALGLSAGGGARADPAAASDPALPAVVEAAQRRAAGTAPEEASRQSRARSAHWAPVVRAQAGVRDDGRTRRGQVRLAPLIEDDLAQSRSWAVVATWDLAQLVYARDEAQLALAHVHLARVRREVADDAVRLYEERWRLRSSLRSAPPGSSRERTDLLLTLLRTTAALDALSGLYGSQVEELESEVLALTPSLAPGATPAAATKSQSVVEEIE